MRRALGACSAQLLEYVSRASFLDEVLRRVCARVPGLPEQVGLAPPPAVAELVAAELATRFRSGTCALIWTDHESRLKGKRGSLFCLPACRLQNAFSA